MDTIRPLDREILTLLSRFGMARAWQVTAWTGGGVWTIEERLRELRRDGLVAVMDAPAQLWDPALGRSRETIIPVWVATRRGARLVGPIPVPGTDRVVQPRLDPPSVYSALTIIPTVDLAVWYRAFGYRVVAPREMRSTERRVALHPDRRVEGVWATRGGNLHRWVERGGRYSARLPSLGAIHPDGSLWAVELELTARRVSAYRAMIRATRAEGLGQVWHAGTKTAGRRILRAGTLEGVRWERHPTRRGVMVSSDGMVRVQGWRPGPVGLDSPTTWRGHVPRSAPAGIAVPMPLPDLRAAWKPAVARAEAARLAALAGAAPVVTSTAA